MDRVCRAKQGPWAQAWPCGTSAVQLERDGTLPFPSLPFPPLPSGSSWQLGAHLSLLRPWEDSAAAKLPPLSPWPGVPGESGPGSGCREAAVSQDKGLGQRQWPS